MICAGTMNFMDAGAVKRLQEFFGRVGEILGNEVRRASFATYAMGILSDAERKSVSRSPRRRVRTPAAQTRSTSVSCTFSRTRNGMMRRCGRSQRDTAWPA